MFILAIITGIFSYTIFFLGVTDLLYKELVISATLLCVVLPCIIFKKELLKTVVSINKELKIILKNKLTCLLLLLFITLIFINLLGALGPETAFDSLWYHLTLPKLYLLNHSVYHIPGGLLYYSDMPKLGELLYVSALAINGEIAAKMVHLLFGILTAVVIYRVTRSFYTPLISLLAVLIFYGNIVVAWESTTAYIDLIRAFFEILALWAFIRWYDVSQPKWLLLTAIMIGLAISTKLLAGASLIIFSILLLWKLCRDKKPLNTIFITLGTFIFISLFIPLPWFLFSYINTGNPIYPLFSEVFAGINTKIFDSTLLDPITLITTFWNIFTRANDPMTPLYLIFIPIILFVYKRIPKKLSIVYFYSLLALLLWYVTSQVEGSRLLIPYFAAFSIVSAAAIFELKNGKIKEELRLYKICIILVILITITTISYRFIANYKYAPVVLGTQSKEEFLSKNLNYKFGDFYDVDGYFKKNIKDTDKVLLYGTHNLYYVEYPFIHESWVKKGDVFNYIAVQNGTLPKRFADWELVYENKKSFIQLYSNRGKNAVY